MEGRLRILPDMLPDLPGRQVQGVGRFRLQVTEGRHRIRRDMLPDLPGRQVWGLGRFRPQGMEDSSRMFQAMHPGSRLPGLPRFPRPQIR